MRAILLALLALVCGTVAGSTRASASVGAGPTQFRAPTAFQDLGGISPLHTTRRIPIVVSIAGDAFADN